MSLNDGVTTRSSSHWIVGTPCHTAVLQPYRRLSSVPGYEYVTPPEYLLVKLVSVYATCWWAHTLHVVVSCTRVTGVDAIKGQYQTLGTYLVYK